MNISQKFGRRLFTAAALAVGLLASAGTVAAEKVKVAAIYTLPVEQQWISRIHKALNTAAESGSIDYTFSENVANTDYERVMREYAEQGHDLIVGEVFGLERAARKVAKDYSETAFLMGSSFGPVAPNFSVFDNWIHEPSYLTGMVAGSMTKSNMIGMVGGYAIPEVNRLMHAFMDGARAVNPDVKFLVNFIDSWYDPPKAKESAFAMMDAGADIMYAERFGVADAAVERGVKAIGNVIDTSDDYPGTILASAIWHMEATIDKAIAKVASDDFEAADYGQYSFMAFGGGSMILDVGWLRPMRGWQPAHSGPRRGPFFGPAQIKGTAGPASLQGAHHRQRKPRQSLSRNSGMSRGSVPVHIREPHRPQGPSVRAGVLPRGIGTPPRPPLSVQIADRTLPRGLRAGADRPDRRRHRQHGQPVRRGGDTADHAVERAGNEGGW